MTTDRRDNKSQNFFYRKYNERVPDPARSAYTFIPSWTLLLVIIVPAQLNLLDITSIPPTIGAVLKLASIAIIILVMISTLRIEYIYFDDDKIVRARSKWWCILLYKRTEIRFSDIKAVQIKDSLWNSPTKHKGYRNLVIKMTLRNGQIENITIHAGNQGPFCSDPRSEQCYKLLREKLQELKLL